MADPGDHTPPISILIGQDQIWSILRDAPPIRGRENEPVAQETIFGFVISGASRCKRTSETSLLITTGPGEELNESFKRFCDLESIGIDDSPVSAVEAEFEEKM